MHGISLSYSPTLILSAQMLCGFDLFSPRTLFPVCVCSVIILCVQHKFIINIYISKTCIEPSYKMFVCQNHHTNTLHNRRRERERKTYFVGEMCAPAMCMNCIVKRNKMKKKIGKNTLQETTTPFQYWHLIYINWAKGLLWEMIWKIIFMDMGWRDEYYTYTFGRENWWPERNQGPILINKFLGRLLQFFAKP